MELVTGRPEEAGMCPQRIKRMENLVQGWAASGVSQAFSIVVARKGIVVSEQTYGSASFEPDAPPLTAETLFPLASITKPITATAAMILVEMGLLCLTFPVSYYIPEFVGEGKQNVKVHHLMTHTSGLRNADVYEHSKLKEGTVEIPPAEPNQHPGLHRRLYLGYDTPLWKPPGTEMSYCGYGVELLGEIIRRVSGQTLESFCKEHIFEPIGMNHTYFVVPESLQHTVIRREEHLPGGKWYHTPEAMSNPSAAGGAYSTAKDIAKFGQMFLNKGKYGDKRILSLASVTEMIRDQAPHVSSTYGSQFFIDASYGYCWPVNNTKRDSGDLFSPQAIVCGGAGGVNITVDPYYETVQVIFSIDSKQNDGYGIWFPSMNLFNNAIIASIEEL
ncbi:serine hydrolase domain-containing protein [Paenibacillus ginsengarvi]|uniref:Class A beta-lactamase-related serine hydrolase n=1 Tax=Paenibacillus ginsengarvi TaxID=400777 RepID=A0A3B0CHS3_9BACL|nr:serine hydrolase domain-containing protein [Paenibacillus ginsengarvi]RKN84278.1 class A beta-lactamase-related serine hydrolase [Paenibacillus ginsengarvi]